MQYINESKHYSISTNDRGKVELAIWSGDEKHTICMLVLPLDQQDILELVSNLQRAYNDINKHYSNLGK